MRISISLLFFAFAALPVHSLARQQGPAVTTLTVHAGTPAQDLACDNKPAVRGPAAPNPDPMEIPSADLLEATPPLAPSGAPPPDPAGLPLPPLAPLRPGEGFRIAIWGDSHLAANFFTEELAKLLKVPADASPNALIPANMGRAGVRLPLRQSCVSAQWKYEPGYLGGEYAAAPGPGLVNLYTDQAGATLAWDIRRDAQSPGYQRVRILYQQTDAPMVVGISIDGDTEQAVTLQAAAGPAALELAAERPMAQVRLRVIDARFRFHGLELVSAQSKPFVLDVFGYPGATVAGWKTANLPYLGAWFAQRQYQLVMLEFGTNEGNVKPFDLLAYRKTLTESVRNMKTIFPDAACILIAPGDRGVLVPRSANVHTKTGAAVRALRKMAARFAPGKRAATPAVDLFEYAKIHAAIARVQKEVAAGAGCGAWSMQDAMGGQGQAYKWAQASPALMSRDLIHFTVAGYRRLAQQFARDMGWSEASAP